ncbi:unnamed protein product [Adineta ricciae]|uniref:G-protein coupled receptors family 1 profile domain-containing protein n=1 Tax=Adineta ricciae TaxID=249248 RepID=A0A816AHS3_ADIRI|nr:unnamed protein product [Adineta ricciae]CAF1597794.1 unnamed protein product [Adineta ricciae]
MSTNSTDAIFISTLVSVTIEINRYLPIGIFFFGIIGNLLNCLALSQRNLRSNPCAFLFLSSSVFNLITLITGVGVRFLTGWSADLTDRNDLICQIRFFVLSTARTIASWLITLAIIDRCLSSSISISYRQMSTFKNAQKGILFIIILSSLAYFQYFYCFVAKPIDYPITCYGRSVLCRLIHNFEFVFLTVLIPSFLMIIFGLMTIYNVHRSTLRQIQPLSTTSTTQRNENSLRKRKTERSLLLMLFVQTTFIILFSLPQAGLSLYSIITQYEVKSALTNAVNTFLLNLFILFTYMTNGMPFYVYTLTGGTLFRTALFNGLKGLFQKIICR